MKMTEEINAMGDEAYHKGDYATALKLYRQAAEQGYAEAESNNVLQWSRQGLAVAQYNLGATNGLGITQNYQEAANWYRKAAEQGHAEAQFSLGNMYNEGQGVTQSYKMAVDSMPLS